MKIYDVSGKLLSGNDFQAYLQQLDITLDYSFDDTLIHDNKNVNAYSCTASEMD
jgi:hypothetical protein